MNPVDSGINAFQTALEMLATGVATFVPRLVVALFAFIVLWIVAIMLGRLVEQIVRSLKIDALLEGLGTQEVLSRAGYHLNTGSFVGGLVRWFFIILALLVAVDILELTRVAEFLSDVVLNYIPNVAVAAIIVIAGALLADMAQKVSRGSAQAANMPAANLIGAISKWAIWIFALAAALFQLGVIGLLIPLQTVLVAFLAMLALAGGLAFGLGGRDVAAEYLDKLKKDMKG
ncbi:MAG: hypothetical protein O2794_02350 [bacterium]|nr:hypothetical protein [bacterium]